MKVVLLIRVSSKEQEENYSLEAQEAKLKQYCDLKGLKDIKVWRIVESSTQGERKEFNKILDWIKEQDAMVALVVDAVDRLQRSFKETVVLTDMMKAKQVELHILKENLVLNEESNPMQYMMWNFAVMCAQNFILSSSYNIKRSNERKLAKGEYIRQAPVGYISYRDEAGKSRIKIDEERAYLVKEAFDLYSTGTYSISTLWKHLRAKKLTVVKKGRTPLIAKSSVHRMLINKFYIGIMEVKGKQYPHNYEKFIDEFTFRKVQTVLKKNNQSNKKEVTKHEYIFKGLLRNKETGRLLSGTTTKGIVYYRSPKFGDSPASKNIKEDSILDQIQALFDKLTIPQYILDFHIQRLSEANRHKNDYKTKLIEKNQKDYNAIDLKLSNLLDLRIASSITQDEYDRKATELKDKKFDLELDLRLLSDEDDKFEKAVLNLLNIFSRASELFRKADIEKKRQLINFVLSNLEIDGDKLVYQAKKPFDVLLETAESNKWYTR